MSQIAELADVVGQELAARRYPHRVTYGPERTRRTGPGISPGVVFARAPTWGAYVAPVATRQGAATPEALRARRIDGTFTVYARSPKSGAQARDHEAEADLVCDAVVSAMVRACKLAGKPLDLGPAELLEGDAFGGQAHDQWPGVAVAIAFSILVPARDVDYLGGGPGTGAADSVSNTVAAKLAGT